MSAIIVDSQDHVITVTISGKLSRAQLSSVQAQGAKLIQKLGSASILVLAPQFEGWEKEGDWGDLSFQYENDPLIKRIAIVADKKWESLALMFAGKGVRQPQIEFFSVDAMERARAWVAEAAT
jgi:hypothetical protein